MADRRSLPDLVIGHPVSPEYLDVIRDKLYFDRPPLRNRYVRFWVLLLLATVIATGGVITNSTATVIGAMIVAPLMTPILATALAVATGDQRNMVRSLAVALGGAAAVVLFSAVITRLVPGPIDTLTNPQITSRTTVGIIEFLVALASGAAGAFGVSREDVSDALPGVAIAISLVPPLCVVGVCLASGANSQALGALLLFATNFIAILVSGGVLFAMGGFGSVAFVGFNARARRDASIAIVVATVLLLIPLGLTSLTLTREAIAERQITAASAAWLSGSRYRLLQTNAENGVIDVVIGGQGTPPTTDALKAQLEKQGARNVTFQVGVVPLTTSAVSSTQ